MSATRYSATGPRPQELLTDEGRTRSEQVPTPVTPVLISSKSIRGGQTVHDLPTSEDLVLAMAICTITYSGVLQCGIEISSSQRFRVQEGNRAPGIAAMLERLQ